MSGWRSRSFLRYSDLESLLNGLHDFLILLAANERDTETLCSETACTAHSMKVGVGIAREVVVDG